MKPSGRPRGRPPIRPEQRTAAFHTFVWIKGLRRFAIQLAQLDPASDAASQTQLEAALVREGVPRELWPQMQRVLGRFRRYRDAPGLTEQQQQRLAELESLLTSKPPNRWTNADRRLEQERAKLRVKLHGKPAVELIEQQISGGISAAGLAVLTTRKTPVHLRGLWRTLDEWGARQHGVAVKTFRDRRRWLANSADPLFATLRCERVSQLRPRRHRAR